MPSMRRTPMLLALPALAMLLPAQPASAACVSGTGVTACPPVYDCVAGSVVVVTVVGVGTGTASCGGAVASCYAFRAGCTRSATAQSAGTLTCAATHNAVAFCTVTVAGA